jgi:8-oxo-dGTP pyrophosphatase MutT (NUDIX family)
VPFQEHGQWSSNDFELLKEIKDQDYFSDIMWKTREASRGIFFDENNLVPLLFVSKHNYHKLPGGGVEEGEDKVKALMRECLEEIGCKIQVDGEVGKTIEFRSKISLKQTSYCYYGKIISKGSPDFTEDELNQGFKIIWLPLKEAIFQLTQDKPKNYHGSFMRERDLVFLKKIEEIKCVK